MIKIIAKRFHSSILNPQSSILNRIKSKYFTHSNFHQNTFNPYHPKYWVFWLIVGLLRLFTWLPYRALLVLGKYLGILMLLTCRRMRFIARVNIKLCFPDLSPALQKKLLVESFISAGIAVFETALAWWGSNEKLRPLIHLHGLSNLQKAAEEKQGVFILGIHFSTLELAGRLFAMDNTLSVVYRENKLPFINYLITRLLKKHYHQGIERKNLRGMIKTLKKGQLLWYTPDIDGGRFEHVFVPFFNIPAASITAPARLPALTGSKTILSSYYRRADGTGYDLYFSPPFENLPSGNIESDIARINLSIEQAVRQKPEQYIWQYMRFKTRPEGEKRFYSAPIKFYKKLYSWLIVR